MGLKHRAKKGTVIEANGVRVTVLRGSPELEIMAPRNVGIKIRCARKRAILTGDMCPRAFSKLDSRKGAANGEGGVGEPTPDEDDQPDES